MRIIPFGKPIIGKEEKKAVADVLDGSILVHGPKAKEFEQAFAGFTGAPNAVSVSSCTAALHLSYFHLGIGKGDEVIVPAQTHVATAHAVELCNAKPIFVDAEKNTGNIDIDQIESAITKNTKALSVVHYLGMPVNMDKINKIAEKHGLFVVEDCALAIGAYFNKIHAGLHGDVGCFSFYPVKHMTTAEGGMLVTKHSKIAQEITYKKAFGVDRHMGERKIPGMYNVNMLGFNYRMNEIGAAIGLEQIKRMNDFLNTRDKNFNSLYTAMKNIDEIKLFESSHKQYKSSYYCLSIMLNKPLTVKKFEIMHYLKNNGIGCSIYYPMPVPHFSYYRSKYNYTHSSFPVASWISKSSIALPVGPHLEKEDTEYIAEKIKNAIMEVK